MKIIRGAGGGGGKGSGNDQHVPVEAADSLRSKAFAQVVDLVSEGEIQGLVDGLKSIYLDKTPIQNADGTYNFTGVTVQTRVGTQGQTYMPGFPNVQNEIAVGTEVLYGVPIVRTVSDTDVDAVRVRIYTPQLSYQNPETGDLGGNSVNYAIDLQQDGAGYVEKVNDTITGKATSRYERTYIIFLPSGGSPWDIRVRKISADSTHAYDQKRIVFESYTEIEAVKLRYPNSALVGVRIDSKNFQNIPTRGYDMKLLRIQVPSNYNATTRAYTGSWDGTFQIAWTDNPAWIWYDLVTSDRYGLGQFISADNVDKWALYTIGQYCDEMIDDGFGSTEPRFTCNVYLQTRAEAYRVMNDLSTVFRGMLYWASGLISLSQDSPQDAIALFTAANVVDGLFTYQGSSAKARHTVALVTWNDPEDFYAQKIEYVEDSEAVASFGVIETQTVAVGCTSRGQANRLGRWILYTERYQTEVVTFQTGLNGAVVRPGSIIKVADPVRAGVRRGGRLSSSSTDSILYLDDDLGIDADAAGLSITVMLPDGTVEERGVDSVDGATVTLTSALSDSPIQGAMWIATTDLIEPQEFRVLAVIEAKPGLFEITALSHNPDKFDAVEQGLVLEERSISALSTIPDAPTNLSITETLYAVGADVRVKVTCSWREVEGATSYAVQYYRDSQNPVTLPECRGNDVEVLNAEPGYYTFIVRAINTVGIRSTPAQASKEILGRGANPADVVGFSLLPVAGQAYLSWTQSEDLDVRVGGSVRIRHSPDIVTALWKNSVDIVPALPGSATRVQAPLLTGTYLAKFVDSSGNASVNAVEIVTTVPDALALNIVEEFSEEDGLFAGAKTEMEYAPEYEGIVISAATLFDDVVDVDAEIAWDFAGGVGSEGSYLFENAIDLTEIYTSKITAFLAVSGFDVTDSIDERLNNMDEWLDLDGEFIDDVNAELFLRTSEDGVTYTDWKRFFVGEYRARYIEFKLVATSGSPSNNVVITGCTVVIDMPDRVATLSGEVSGAGLHSVVFDYPFKDVPAVSITATGMISGDYFTIANKTRSGFDITFKNAAGAAVSKTFDVLAKGYGREVS